MYIEAYLNRIYLKNKNVKVNIRLHTPSSKQNSASSQHSVLGCNGPNIIAATVH